jgi:hypothetical protein
VQAEASGPAIFVALDPSTLSPSLAVGDLVDFTVTELDTSSGQKQVTDLSGLSRTSSGNSIEPLITEVGTATDLVTNLDAYESRVIRLSGAMGVFMGAGSDFVAAPIATTGLTDSDLRLRIPETTREELGLVATCTVGIDYGVMWRFNGIAQVSVFAADDLDPVACPAPPVVSAAALDSTHVRVTFDRAIAPASVTAPRFTFDNGITASAAAIASTGGGTLVDVTTNALSTSVTYTVTVAPEVTVVLGTGVGTPGSATFEYEQIAVVTFNEINPSISGSRDLIELLVLSGGTVNGIVILQNGSSVETLATLPDVTVAASDLIVVHLNPVGATGAAPGSETIGKAQYPTASYTVNYDSAWDFHGGATGLTYSNRVLELRPPGSVLQDVVPVVVSTSASPPSAFPGDLQALQAAGDWLPANCGGVLCTYVSTPTALAISVDYLGCGDTATGATIQREVGGYGSVNTDWNAAAAHSWGLVNP